MQAQIICLHMSKHTHICSHTVKHVHGHMAVE